MSPEALNFRCSRLEAIREASVVVEVVIGVVSIDDEDVNTGGAEETAGEVDEEETTSMAAGDDEEEDDDLLILLLFFLHPPPTGTFLKVPPLVQYLLQALQKCLG
nr:Armadillo-type fold [Ipomoea batatas]